MNALTQPLGPLPVWGWGAIAGTAVVAVMYWSRAGSAAPVGTASVAAQASAVDSAALWNPTASLPVSTGTTATQTIATQETWLAQAVKLLTDNGIAPLSAMTALQKWVGGQPLTTAESETVNKGLALAGAPPSGTYVPVATIAAAPAAPNYYSAATYVSFSRPGHSAGDDTVWGLTTTGERHALNYAEWISVGAPVGKLVDG